MKHAFLVIKLLAVRSVLYLALDIPVGGTTLGEKIRELTGVEATSGRDAVLDEIGDMGSKLGDGAKSAIDGARSAIEKKAESMGDHARDAVDGARDKVIEAIDEEDRKKLDELIKKKLAGE